jgi:hypothetical protein
MLGHTKISSPKEREELNRGADKPKDVDAAENPQRRKAMPLIGWF